MRVISPRPARRLVSALSAGWANPIWMDWKVEADPLLHEQFEIMWQKLVTR